MLDILADVLEWMGADERVAMATVVRVEGSAPRPVGARMIVSTGERMAGSVSGGCVESTVYQELMDVLNGGPPRLLKFGITDDMIWDVGLACGGTIHVFCHELDPDLVDALADQAEGAEPFVLATVLSGAAIGQVALITAEGVIAGEARKAVVSAARELIETRAPGGARGEVRQVAPGVQVFIEPFLPPPMLLIIGGVHVAIPLVRLAKELGFYVVVVDPREKFANPERFPEADELFVEWPDEALAHLEIDDATYIVLLTHDPKIDEPTLAAALQTEAAYIGAIGSRGTHAARYERMARWGVTPEQLARVYGPIGLDLGGKSPAETALAIIAEVVAVKNGRQGRSLREAVNRG